MIISYLLSDLKFFSSQHLDNTHLNDIVGQARLSTPGTDGNNKVGQARLNDIKSGRNPNKPNIQQAKIVPELSELIKCMMHLP